MKSPFKNLRCLGLGLRPQRPLAQLDELSQASQDLQDMKDCYDSLLSCAAATANSAYEFSESLREMGDCLLQKTSLNDDEDSGKVLLMLGKVQFQIQNLLDNYSSHISRTITVPSESLLNELRIVEDMKTQCDEKRVWYDDIKIKHKERKRLGSKKGEYVSSNQVRAAKEEFEEDATLFTCRMKSLKGAQSRSLLTQVARHHAAQMCFFRKALKSLETIDPIVQLVTQQHHIDYQFSGLEDDDRDSVFLTDNEEESDEDEDEGDGELSFAYQRNDPKNHQISSSENSGEVKLESVHLTFPQVAPSNSIKEHRKPLWNSSSYNITANTGSKSAPLSARSNMDTCKQSSARKVNTYVLPTPVHTQQQAGAVWHSSPLERKSNEKHRFSGPINNSISKPTPLPCPVKPERYAFSGPLAHSSSNLVSGSFVSSPEIKISELHELPRPPAKAGFSAPLLTFAASTKLHSA